MLPVALDEWWSEGSEYREFEYRVARMWRAGLVFWHSWLDAWRLERVSRYHIIVVRAVLLTFVQALTELLVSCDKIIGVRSRWVVR